MLLQNPGSQSLFTQFVRVAYQVGLAAIGLKPSRQLFAECFAGIGSASIDVAGAEPGRVEVLIVTADGDTVGSHVNEQSDFRVAWLVLPGDCYHVLVSNRGTHAVDIRPGGDAQVARRALAPAETTAGRPA